MDLINGTCFPQRFLLLYQSLLCQQKKTRDIFSICTDSSLLILVRVSSATGIRGEGVT